MDPNANLTEQLTLATRIINETDAEEYLDVFGNVSDPEKIKDCVANANRLAELVKDLHDHLKMGGFAPAAWNLTSVKINQTREKRGF